MKDFQKKNDSKNIERIKFALERMKVYTSFDQMLDELEGDLDLVDNCTPGRSHVQLAMQAMEHGYNAMSEKPPALNFVDAQRLVRTEEKTGKKFRLSEQVCYERSTQTMRKVIMEGKLGAIKELNVQFGHGGPYVPYVFGDTGLPHFIDPLLSGGGCLQDLAPHGISQFSGQWVQDRGSFRVILKFWNAGKIPGS